MAGAAIATNSVDRDFCYIIGGMDYNRKLSKKFLQVKYNEDLGQDELNCARMLQDLPEPRIHHSAICIRGKVIVTGGLSSYAVDMEMCSQVPCEQKCWIINVRPYERCEWKELPSMEKAGGLGATLISIDNRYVW